MSRPRIKGPSRLPKEFDTALWLWGRMRDFERDGYAQKNPQKLFELMTDTMRADVKRIAPVVAKFLQDLAAEAQSRYAVNGQRKEVRSLPGQEGRP